MSYLQLIGSNGSYILSQAITHFCFNYEPSWSFNELMNGQIAQKYDLGIGADKLYSDLELTLNFAQFQLFTSFFRATKGNLFSFSSDLDLFFPGYSDSGSCLITKYEDKGYLSSDIMTGYRCFTLRLYAPNLFPNLSNEITYSASLPSCFYRGIWEQKTTYSDKINVVENGQSFEYNTWTNDSNDYTVSYKYLTQIEAQEMMSWIATVRAQKLHIITSDLNLSKSKDVTIDLTNRANDFRYMIKDFSFTNEGTYYTLNLTLNLVS